MVRCAAMADMLDLIARIFFFFPQSLPFLTQNHHAQNHKTDGIKIAEDEIAGECARTT